MKIIDERESQKKKKKKQRQKRKEQGGTEAYSERVRDKWFCCVIINFIITM